MDNHEYELVHHGVTGMKWGIRRYQNRDGTLTNAGKKRYQKELAKVRAKEQVVKNKEQVKAKMDRLNARKQKVEDREEALKEPKKDSKKETKKSKVVKEIEKKVGPKSLSEMSDQELQAVVTRLNLEKRYKELRPEEKSKGRKFMSGLMDKVVVPATTTVGKKALEDWLGGKVDDLMGKTDSKPKEKKKSEPKQDKPKKEQKKKVYEKPTFESKDTFVWDDDWWNTPYTDTRSSNDDFADLFGLPAPTKKRKKK